ncbi:MAG: hypothetical protein HWD86_06620 [Kangiellaceae bacterium]|nr:hypothetical protein [Kangiellaceae bacterium]
MRRILAVIFLLLIVSCLPPAGKELIKHRSNIQGPKEFIQICKFLKERGYVDLYEENKVSCEYIFVNGSGYIDLVQFIDKTRYGVKLSSKTGIVFFQEYSNKKLDNHAKREIQVIKQFLNKMHLTN